ncbi:MAG: flagellar hook-basal body complex protein FliE [Buchnera aphidicola (Nurudea yanoniella)]
MLIDTMEDSIKLMTTLGSLMNISNSEDKNLPESFLDYVKNTFNILSSDQKKIENESKNLEKNENKPLDLHDLLIKLQKNLISTETILQVRNKLMSGYQEMMNLQI